MPSVENDDTQVNMNNNEKQVNMNNNDNEKLPNNLTDFLNLFRITQQDKLNNVRVTHTALPNPGFRSGGSYHIPSDKLEDFLKVYANDVFNNNQLYHLTEAHHPEVSPILIDLDFRQKIEDNPDINKVYTQDDIKLYLKEFHNVLSQYIDDKELKEKEIAFVMEKSKATKGKNGEIKDKRSLWNYLENIKDTDAKKLQLLNFYLKLEGWDTFNKLFDKKKTATKKDRKVW